ncbi:MAG: beta-hydroxyacyl-ACP dehydratase [Nitrospirae bacterium]|nr:beta-hydroxyacyl-ACP dehydratase [Nitrospirota bacterium]
MRYLLIDHITEWKSGASIRGVKNVAMSEDFLEFHFPKNPIMPGVLLLEALTQLTGWLEAASSDFANWFLIGKVRKSNFYSFALPGDQVELEVELISDQGGGTEIPPLKKGDEGGFSERNPNTRVYRGTGMVKGKKKIVAEFEGVIVPVNEIEDIEEQRKFFKVLTREPRS